MKIGISTFGTAGDILPMLEFGRRLESKFGHDVSYLIFALDDTDYGKPVVRLDFDGERFANSDAEWMKPTALSALLHASISRNYDVICEHSKAFCGTVDSIVNHYLLKPMQAVNPRPYTSFTLCPGAINSGIPQIEAAIAIGENNILAVDPLFGGSNYYIKPSPKQSELEFSTRPVFMGFGSSQKFINNNALSLFEEIESKLDRECLIQGRDFDEIDYQEVFPLCSHVIHHGGCGTTHIALNARNDETVYPLTGEALFHSRAGRGVKQIIVPLQGENLYWATQIQKRGLGFNAYNRPVDDIVKYIHTGD